MASLSVDKFVGIVGTWLHPGKSKAMIQLLSDGKVQFDQFPPHGQAFAYADSQCADEFLVLIFDGSGKSMGPSSLSTHLLQRINETVFRDTYGYQIIVFGTSIAVNPFWLATVLSYPDNFVQSMTLAWLHPGRETQYVILGECEDQPRVIFCSRQDSKLVYCKPHGTWRYFESVLDCKECNEVMISSVSMTSKMVCVTFHSSADEKNLNTFTLHP